MSNYDIHQTNILLRDRLSASDFYFPVCTACVPAYVDGETRKLFLDVFVMDKVNMNNIFNSYVNVTRIELGTEAERCLDVRRMKLGEWIADKKRIWIILLGPKVYRTRCNIEKSIRIIESISELDRDMISLLQMYIINHLLSAEAHVLTDAEAMIERSPRERVIFLLNTLDVLYPFDTSIFNRGQHHQAAFECQWRITRRWFSKEKSYASLDTRVERDYFCPPFLAHVDQQLSEYFRRSVERFSAPILLQSVQNYKKLLNFVSFTELSKISKWFSGQFDDGDPGEESCFVIDACFLKMIDCIGKEADQLRYIFGKHTSEWTTLSNFWESYVNKRSNDKKVKYI